MTTPAIYMHCVTTELCGLGKTFMAKDGTSFPLFRKKMKMTDQSKYFKTTIKVEILSLDSLCDSMSLLQLYEAITEGDCSGTASWEEIQELTKEQMIDEAWAQGTDPIFFGINKEE